jgi:hypothetical protein
MIRAVLEFKNSRFFFQYKKEIPGDWRKITSKDHKQFKKWINSYRHAIQDHTQNNRDTLLHIGGEIYGWLNGAGGWLDKFFNSSSNPPFILEFNQKFFQGGQFLQKAPPLAAGGKSVSWRCPGNCWQIKIGIWQKTLTLFTARYGG